MKWKAKILKYLEFDNSYGGESENGLKNMYSSKIYGGSKALYRPWFNWNPSVLSQVNFHTSTKVF